MILFRELLLNTILVIFPFLIYFVYTCYKNITNQKESDLLFDFSLITSLYLCLRLGNIDFNDKVLLFCNVPILIAYLKNREGMGILLSLFVILYCTVLLKLNCLILLLKYLLYFIAYHLYKKKNINDEYFIKIVALFQGFFISFEYFFSHTGNILIFFELFLVILLFYTIPFIILYLYSLTDNISSMYMTVKELEHEKQIKESLFKITHEIKNPIAVCKGYLDMMDITDKEKTQKYLTIISQEINRCLDIMQDFMEFNKVKAKKEELDINFLLDDIYDGLKILADSKNIKLKYKSNNSEIYINGDYNRLKQVIVNIVKNSIEAISEKGIIKMKGYEKNNKYYIEIEDNGSGMSEETLKKITEMFFTTKKCGTGLGVPLSNEIIKAHLGSLSYESKINSGTKAIIELPIL